MNFSILAVILGFHRETTRHAQAGNPTCRRSVSNRLVDASQRCARINEGRGIAAERPKAVGQPGFVAWKSAEATVGRHFKNSDRLSELICWISDRLTS